LHGGVDGKHCGHDPIQRALAWSVSKLSSTVALGWAIFSCTALFPIKQNS
jgi:hypothetical protein